MASGRFEEKEYESHASDELNASWLWLRSGYWPVGQVLEGVLGFDAGFDPAKREIWRLLRMPRPRGITVTPAHWFGSPSGLPCVPDLSCQRVSLFVNFKRPESYKRKGRKLFGTPYFRFSVRNRSPAPNQHAILTALATNIGENFAVVRYAAAAFQLRSELESLRATRDVLSNSCFVSPLSIPAPHTAWAYQGPGLLGAPNPDGPSETVETVDGLVRTAVRDREPTDLGRHLSVIAEAAGETLPRRTRASIDQWVAEAARSTETSDFPTDYAGRLRDLVTISTAITRAGAAWVHIARPAFFRLP
jgi:hypothetical protein